MNGTKFMTQISQGPWTRIRPLQRDEIDPYTEGGMVLGELTWGRFRNNLCKVMAYTPRLLQTEVEYCNSFIFDPPTFRGDVQESGFVDRFLKEMVISRTSLINRSRYSVTHHSFIGMKLFSDAGRREEAIPKYLHLHEHEKHPEVYTERERVVLNFTAKVTRDAHSVTDEEFQELRRVLREDNVQDAGLKQLSDEKIARHVDSQIVEITWLIGHFCLLNRWFTVLQVPDETAQDEDNFGAAYEALVPKEIRQRNTDLLKGDF
jgi:alkylhydroperoxidase family enzyme